MQGRRVYPNADGSFRWLERGDYLFEPKSGRWLARSLAFLTRERTTWT